MLQMFIDDIENKAKRLETAFRRYCIDCGDGVRVVISEETHQGIRAHPVLETAAQEFVNALRFSSNIRGLKVSTDAYRRRMEEQRIKLNY